MDSDKLSLIIVSFNHEREITSCLDAVAGQVWPMDVYVIDNASNDGTQRAVVRFISGHPELSIRPVWNAYNTGYAHAVNQGLRLCRTPWIALLGPDARPLPGAAGTLVGYLKRHPEAGLVGPRLFRPDGGIQPSCRRFPIVSDLLFELSGLPRAFPKRFQLRWKMPGFGHDSATEVEQLEATCLFIRKKAVDETGLMDERFPIFFNDVDWCRRFHERGWKTVFLPQAGAEHDRGSSVFRRRNAMIWKSHQGFYRYFKKYAGGIGGKILIEPLGFLLIWTALIRCSIRTAVSGTRSPCVGKPIRDELALAD
jgi:GT2 family glycosyltransferase